MTTTTSPTTLHEKVEAALETIRPYLAADGGNVRITEITPNNEVYLELMGACESCPMSAMTLKAGVEQAIISSVPEITAVKAVNL